MSPAVSVVMPVFNGSRFLDRAFASLRIQTWTDWELLAVDDASTDDSAARLAGFAARDPRVRVFRHPANRGQSAARNTALSAARGELVAYLDQDDEFSPDHLERAWSLRGRADVLLFRYDLVEERPGPGFGGVTAYDPAPRLPHIDTETIAVPLGIVHRRELLDRCGAFNEALGRHRGRDEDGDLWRRFAHAGARFLPVAASSGRYHVRADSFARTRPLPPAAMEPPAAPNDAVAVEVARGTVRHVLWMPPAETDAVRRVFETGDYGGVKPAWLSPTPFVVDRNARCGAFALYAKLAFGPRTVIHGFESHPPHRELFRRNLAGLTDVTLHPLGPAKGMSATDRPVDSSSEARTAAENALRDAEMWDGLDFSRVDVLKFEAESDILDRLSDRLRGIRVVLADYRSPSFRRQIDSWLPEHLLFGAVIHSPQAGILKYVRGDLAG